MSYELHMLSSAGELSQTWWLRYGVCPRIYEHMKKRSHVLEVQGGYPRMVGSLRIPCVNEFLET